MSTHPQKPAPIPADETYYWSPQWQEGVRESMAALANGDYIDFDSNDPNDATLWLTNNTDDADNTNPTTTG